VVSSADVDAACHDGDGGGNGPCGANILFDQTGGFDVLGIRHAMRDDGGFKCHKGAMCCHGLGDFGG
jgi:hypothetical protein